MYVFFCSQMRCNMKEASIFLVLILLQISETFADELDDKYGKVIFVNFLFRHGDRTPLETYPNDPYKDRNKWPVDWGQLTDRGIARHFTLGKWFRKNYANLFTERYDPKIINVLSTDIDRTLMSAQSNLAGMFTPKPKDIPLQPIAIHTIPKNLDQLLAMKMPCPKYDMEYDKFNRSIVMQDMYKKYDKLIQYLLKHTGDTLDKITKLEMFYGTLFIESQYFTLPIWAKRIMNELELAAGDCMKLATYTTTLKRLRSGPLIKQMLQLMHNKWNLKESFTRNIQVFSAHDLTIAGFLNSMQIFDMLPPPFASSVMVELREKGLTPYVTIRYKKYVNNTEPVILTVPGCIEQGCTLANLTKLLMPVIPLDWIAECNDFTSFNMSIDQSMDLLL